MKGLLKGFVLIGVLLLALSVAACQGGGAESAGDDIDPVSVVQQYYDAYNAGDLDTAVSFIADDALSINPLGTFNGKERIRGNLEFMHEGGTTFQPSDFVNEKGRVTYTFDVVIDGEVVEHVTNALTIVEDGMIVFNGRTDTEPES